MAKIVFDFDGTIFSTAKRMVDLAKQHYPSSYKGGTFKDIKEFGFKPVIDLGYYELQNIFEELSFYREDYVMEGAIEYIKELQDRGHEVEILTVGTARNNYHKSLLLERLGIDIKLTCITHVGTGQVSMDKGTYYANCGMDYSIYVDDRRECLDTVKGFTHKIQFRESGYALEEDKLGHYIWAESWHSLKWMIDSLIEIGEDD